MRKAFDELELHSVSASIRAGNEASERLLRSVGFRYVGTLREGFRDDRGLFVDRMQYDLLAVDLTPE
jgi:RimJ/RimL family protein N-acetyltransferase